MNNIPTSFASATVAVALSLLASVPVDGADTVYRNDFSARTSVGAVPYGEWREVPYAVGKLVNDSYTDPFGVVTLQSDLQDNWIRGANNGAANARIIAVDGNQCVALCDPESLGGRHVVVKHRIGNVFTNGTVVAQADFRAPNPYDGWGDQYGTRFMVGDETFFSPETSAETYMGFAAAAVGIVEDGQWRFWNKTGDRTSGALAAHWYRAVVTVNIDARTWGVDWYDLGAGVSPTLETETPATPALSIGGLAFDSAVKNEVSAIGLVSYTPFGGADGSEPDKAACFDNIRVSHNGVECYVNDFATRRSRSLAVGATTASYAATNPATNIYAYAAGTNLLANQVANQQVQPIGVDGWRRLNMDQTGMLRTLLYQGDVVAQTSDDTAKFDCAGHTLGQTFASGKVRLAADTTTTALGDGGWVYVALGNDVHYAGNKNTYSSGVIASAGLSGEKVTIDGVVKRKLYYRSGSASVKPGDAVRCTHWLRLVIEVDLDAKTYDFSVFQQNDGASHPAFGSADGTLLYAKTGITLANPLDSISSFSLNSYWSISYFDNVCVWHVPTGGAASLIYYNTFSKRMVWGYGGVEEPLVGTLARHPAGLDGWTRLGIADGGIVVVGGANQTLGFGEVGGSSSVYAVHDLGQSFTDGKLMTQFDICAPSAWNGNDGGAFVWLGGDQFHEGSLNGGENAFYKWAACGVGLNDGAFAAYNGNGAGAGAWQTNGTATAGHWYRFVVKSDISASSSAVKVFDMGTTQPTIETATPNTGAVSTFSAMSFRQSEQTLRGISCVAVEAKGVKAASPFVATDSRVLVDNISISWQSSALFLIVR